MQLLICRQYFTDLRKRKDNSSFSLYKILCWYPQKIIEVWKGQGESLFIILSVLDEVTFLPLRELSYFRGAEKYGEIGGTYGFLE